MITPKIQNIYGELTNAERKLADYVLSHPEDVVRMTAKELAGVCNTAPSAVIRMCKSVGTSGFADLKISLASELGKGSASNKTDAESGDVSEAAFGNVFRSSITTLENTFEMLDFDTVRQITLMIKNASRVFFFGIGTSSVIAIDAAYRFSQIGIQAYSYTDILYMNSMAMNLNENDVAICISHTGKTKTVIDALLHAKSAGAHTVSVTSYSKSILARESDAVISVYADDENYPVEAVSARIAHMCIIDALVMSLAEMKKDELPELLAKRDKIINEIKYK